MGLGAEYERQRAALGAPLPGQVCPRCGGSLLNGEPLDAGHEVDRAVGGDGSRLRWEHARCNRAAGGRLRQALGRLRQAHERADPPPSRRW